MNQSEIKRDVDQIFEKIMPDVNSYFSQQIPSIDPSQAMRSHKDAKTSFMLGLFSFLLPLFVVLIGIPFTVHVYSSVRQEQNWVAIMLYLSEADLQDRTLFPNPQYSLPEGLKMLADLMSVIFVILIIIGLVLGIITKRIRKRSPEPPPPLLRAGSVFSTLGIIVSVIGMIISGILLYIPYYLVRLNIYSPFM